MIHPKLIIIFFFIILILTTTKSFCGMESKLDSWFFHYILACLYWRFERTTKGNPPLFAVIKWFEIVGMSINSWPSVKCWRSRTDVYISDISVSILYFFHFSSVGSRMLFSQINIRIKSHFMLFGVTTLSRFLFRIRHSWIFRERRLPRL